MCYLAPDFMNRNLPLYADHFIRLLALLSTCQDRLQIAHELVEEIIPRYPASDPLAKDPKRYREQAYRQETTTENHKHNQWTGLS